MWNPSDGTIDHDTIYLGNGQVAVHSNSCPAVSATTWYQSSYPDLTQYLIHINNGLTTRYVSLSGNLAFGNVTAGSSAQTTLTIYNGGNSPLTVSSISLPSGFSGNWSGTIPSAGSQTVTVTSAPTAATTYGGTVTVNSNDTAGTATVSASGTGVTIGTTAAVAVSGGTPTYGQALTFTATIMPASGSGETGTVQFEIDGTSTGSPAPLSGNTATYTTSVLAAGSHTVVAVYSGDGKFSTSTSSTLNQSVGTATLTITANSAGKAYGTLASLGSTAFTQTGLVMANGDSITGVTETCTGCAVVADAGSYAIVPTAAAAPASATTRSPTWTQPCGLLRDRPGRDHRKARGTQSGRSGRRLQSHGGGRLPPRRLFRPKRGGRAGLRECPSPDAAIGGSARGCFPIRRKPQSQARQRHERPSPLSATTPLPRRRLASMTSSTIGLPPSRLSTRSWPSTHERLSNFCPGGGQMATWQRRLIGFGLPCLLSWMLDFGLTLHWRPPVYWAGDDAAHHRGSPVDRRLYFLHPAAEAAGQFLVIALVVGLLVTLPEVSAVVVAIASATYNTYGDDLGYRGPVSARRGDSLRS